RLRKFAFSPESIPNRSTMTGAEIRSSRKQRPKSRTIPIAYYSETGPIVSKKIVNHAESKSCERFDSIQGEFWSRSVLSLHHDRHFSPNFQSERSDRFKLPLVGMAALSPGCIST